MINLTQEQVARMEYLFYTPTAELPKEKLVEQLNAEFEIDVPESAYALLFQAVLGKTTGQRPHKVRPEVKVVKPKVEKVTEFVFSVGGKQLVVDTKEKSFTAIEVVDDQGYEPFVVSPDEVVEESTNEQDVDVTENTDEVETFSAQTAFNPFN